MTEQPEKETLLADDATEPIRLLIKLRLPWLLVGLAGGIFITIFISRFEKLLADRIALAFFIPIIAYLSDAVGTQTETILVRNINKRKINIPQYLAKEFMVGVIIGLVFGTVLGLFAFIWFGELDVAITVAIAMLLSMTTATVLAVIAPLILKREHSDPAVGAGPVTTVVQDMVSVVIYFVVATLVIFR